MQLKAPITYNIYDGDKLVFKTKSATKASDYRVTNGKHLSIMAMDSIGNTKKLYADGGMVESKINNKKMLVYIFVYILHNNDYIYIAFY